MRFVIEWLKRSDALYGLVHRRRHQRAIRSEMALLRAIVDPSRAALDIGAHGGAFTHGLVSLGASVIAFEPHPGMAAHLRRIYPHSKVRVMEVAVSSLSGQSQLRFPGISADGHQHLGLSTIHETNALDGQEGDSVVVETVTLDSLALPPVGFIKIDVEGHEMDVLLGSKDILSRHKPALYIEAEERHRPDAVSSLAAFLSQFGYSGFMEEDGRLRSLSGFSVAKDQNVTNVNLLQLSAGKYTGRYINNFVFLA